MHFPALSCANVFGIFRAKRLTEFVSKSLNDLFLRYGYILETQVKNHYPVMFCGDTGTGKSVVIKDKLMKGMGEKVVSLFMNFSANSKANQTQDIIDGKVDKRRKGVFGPPLGKTLVVFVDDLNMPSKETYGAQPPIEILRQHMHWGGWWDRKEIEWRQLVDMVYVTAMGLPGGARTHITGRYSRWFNIIFLTPFDDEGMTRIFSTILGLVVSKSNSFYFIFSDYWSFSCSNSRSVQDYIWRAVANTVENALHI
jgi:dynein heavy chain